MNQQIRFLQKLSESRQNRLTMAKIVRTQGSGITKTTILQLEAGADLPFLVDAVKHMLRTALSFAFTQQDTRATAKSILRKYALPTETRGIYVVEDDAWKQTEGVSSSPASYDSFRSVFVNLKISPDSPQGYAAEVLVLNDMISDRMVDRPDEAFALAFQLGGLLKEAEMKSDWEADAMRGEKIVRDAEAGDVMAHGSREIRDLKIAGLREEYQAHLAKGLKPMAAYRAIADRVSLSPKTVQRKIRKK
jgi:hypothetical protein